MPICYYCTGNTYRKLYKEKLLLKDMKNRDNRPLKMPGDITKYTVISNDGRYTLSAIERLDGSTEFTDLEEVLHSPEAMKMLLPSHLEPELNLEDINEVF